MKAARRTSRLEAIVHYIGIALCGRPAASLARRLMLPVSRDMLLRVVRRRVMPSGTAPVRIVGIDDFAWKRGQRYGTIVCDLERRRVIDLLPDREAATVAAWLAAHPEITIVSRDRGGSYEQAATQGAAQAVQVADRWHLMENASAAFLEAVRRSMPSIRRALAASEVDPTLLTCAERFQHDGFLRRQESNKIVKDLAKTGVSIKEITRQTGRSRKLVRNVLRGADGDMFRCRSNTLGAYLAKLGAEWDAGCHNGAEGRVTIGSTQSLNLAALVTLPPPQIPAAGMIALMVIDVCSACTAFFRTSSASISDRPELERMATKPNTAATTKLNPMRQSVA